ncbi:MAG: hypothetical protein FVQ85_18395 [Planctomycetes bacterium]|nr:hypothetical protein [Planctomycetota bacterium]
MKKTILPSIVVTLILLGLAPAETRLVPAEYTTIQNAIDAAVDGDVVIVATGTYTGPGNRDIDFGGKAITVQSTDPQDPDVVTATVIDCQGTEEEPHRGFYFHNSEGPHSVLAGLTITNGYGPVESVYTYPVSAGGAIFCIGSSPTIIRCSIEGNFAKFKGGGICCKGCNPIVVKCRFISNSAHNGGGMCNEESSPMVFNCTFSGNSVSEYGGGMYNHINANPIITNCTVKDNTASHGGGIRNAYYSSPKITNCIFSDNSANYGGGVRCYSYSSPTISNCTFIGNSAIEWGGAVLNSYDSNPKISNCTFSGNSAGEKGHVMSNYHSNPILTNCIIWGNTDNFSSQIALRESSTLSVSYCNIQGGQMAIYIVEDSWINWGDGNIDTNPLLKTDGYHLQPGSPCIDVGDPAVDYRRQTDIDSQPRVIAGRVDIGADEYGMESPPLISVLPAQIEFITFVGDPNLHLLRLSLFNLGSEPINWSITEDCSWLNVSETSGSITGDLVWITLNIDAGDLSQGRYICDIAVSDGNPTHCSAIVTATLIVHLEGLLHVPKDFPTIQAAINAADDGDTVVVADGTYTGNSNRKIDFCGKVITVRSENGPVNCIIDCQNVGMGVYFHNNEGANSVLAGFTITNAYDRGIYCNRSSPTINNCVLSNNYGGYGGGLSNYESSPSITNCIFRWNSSRQGGGIDNYVSNPTITNCIFSANTATYIGGGIYNHESSPVLTNCIFSNNWTALLGGGINNWYHSSPFLVNCIFSGNLAGGGGAICSERHSYPTLTNCILWGNAAMRGNNICLASYHWTGTYTAGIFVNYSDVEGGESGVYVETGCTLNWGEGNIDADPCFVFPKYLPPLSPAPPVSASYMSDIEDYIWTEYDYHLLPDSPCIDAGDPNYVAGHNETDLDGKPRIIGCQIDMGVYEYGQLVPSEVRIVPRTISLESRGKWITAFLWLPEGYAVTDIADIDSHSLLLDYEIEPERFRFNEEKQVVMANFSQEEVQTFLNVGEFELSISLQLMDGTVFEGRDLIRVVQKSGGKPDKYVQASNPNPVDGAIEVSTKADLSWTASPYVTSHDVYFGTSNPPPFVCNQIDTAFDPGTMDRGHTYYWRIDEVNKWGKATGQLWSFTTISGTPPPPPPP